MKFIIAWFFATTCMTLFSYGFYYFFKKESREPHILNIIILNEFPEVSNNKFYKIIGWIIHYMVGISFLILNILLDKLFGNTQAIILGLPFGIIAGLLGIFGWKIIFKAASYIPKMNYLIFYYHLMFAHIIFCMVSLVVYNYYDSLI